MNASASPAANDRRAASRLLLIACGLGILTSATYAPAAELVAAAHFRQRVQPILEKYCYDCHGNGASEGGRSFDQFDSDEGLLGSRELWWAVLKNVRANIMPPAGEARPNTDERRVLFDWIKYDAFGIDPANPDPGHVTLRRLNRVEYRNTIHDLMGIDYNTADEFPADDAGYGFDNIGDVLSLSPLQMEKYLQAAEQIVEKAVPTEPPTGGPPSHLKPVARALAPLDAILNAGDLVNAIAPRPELDDDLTRARRQYERFFPHGSAPADEKNRDAYAREILKAFVHRAYRRPVNDATIERLLALAKSTYDAPGQSFESGISQAMVAVLASPRFLFRVEDVAEPTTSDRFPLIDEHALASRLSYFLWSSMPDDKLLALADRGELRANLPAQVKRMLLHRHSEALAKNFAGQWLRARDVENFEVDLKFGPELANAMRNETEMYFDFIAHADCSVLELIDSNYTFVNHVLAKHYGMNDVMGGFMRRVELPAGSPRGGVLTQGTVLVVTSNPTRTSPVKRGLFILDNILGTPPPPPPGNVPPLEDAASQVSDHKPTVRELQELHRKAPLCQACHARMDPLGLALENFNALGVWRDTEKDRPVDATGTLLTGEEFNGPRELKQILKTQRRLDFYRCLTQKLLTYAIGRGLEYYDEQTVDQIVEQLDREDGRFSVLLNGIIQSAPFQRQRHTP